MDQSSQARSLTVYSSSTKYAPEYYLRMLILKWISQRRALSVGEGYKSEQYLNTRSHVHNNAHTGSISHISWPDESTTNFSRKTPHHKVIYSILPAGTWDEPLPLCHEESSQYTSSTSHLESSGETSSSTPRSRPCILLGSPAKYPCNHT